MNGLKQPTVGESYRQLVTLVKIKKGVPTVIRVDGREYVLRSPDQFGAGRRKRDDRTTSH